MSTARSYYDRYWSTSGFNPTGLAVTGKLHELFATHIGRSDDVLDLGCGDGKSAEWITEHAASYKGVDVSEAAVELVLQRGYDAQVIEDASRLPFVDDSFDVVVCVEVLEHLIAATETGAEIRRVLRPGGRLIATVPNIAHYRTRMDLALFGRWHPGGDDLSVDQPWRDPHVRFFTPKTMRAFLESVGLATVDVGGFADGPLLARLPVLRRLARGGPSALGARLAERVSLLATRVYAVARKD